MVDEHKNSGQDLTKVKEPNKRRWASIIENPMPTVAILMAIITTLLVMVIVSIIFNILDLNKFVQRERERILTELGQFIEAEKGKFQERTAMLTYAQYADTVERYTSKLATNNSGQKISAIWVLLDILTEVKSNHPDLFSKIVNEYSGAIPYLKLDIAPVAT